MRFAPSMLALALAATLGTAVSFAQAPAMHPAFPRVTKLFASSSEVAALIEKAKRDHKPGQANVLEPLLSLAPYRALLEYRTAVGPAAVHIHQDEFLYVIDGSGTLITGGKLVHPVQVNAENLSGDSIIGGTAVSIAKGDFIVVPENTPHWFSSIHGHVTDISLHVPGSEAR
ncbi:MAG: hypothetical protein ACREFO_03485 [Acetobacteraceae bacterium]